MTITSHFIGMVIKKEYFMDLFNDLSEYLLNNNIKNKIELQNIDSLHITLYYLEKDISGEVYKLKADLKIYEKNSKNLGVFIEKNEYFKRNGQLFLSYFSIKNQDWLIKINKEMGRKYKKDNLADNMCIYIPHLSLFKIVDSKLFKRHKEKIEKIVNSHLENIKVKNVLKAICMFAVDSTTKPETQIPIQT